MTGDDLNTVVPEAFAKLHPGWVPTHVVAIVEAYDPVADTMRLVQIVDADLSAWTALGMAQATVVDLSATLARDGAWAEGGDADQGGIDR